VIQMRSIVLQPFHDQGLMIRVTGETIALSPPLIASENDIGEIFEKVARVIKSVS
jgi:beta-alanine--pyruvate transaminase